MFILSHYLLGYDYKTKQNGDIFDTLKETILLAFYIFSFL